jgi:hypothetical protein
MKHVHIVRSLTKIRYRSVATAAFSHCIAGLAAHSILHRPERSQVEEHGRLF